MTDICSSGRTSTTSPARQPKPDDNFNPHSLTQIILFNYECTKLILFLKNRQLLNVPNSTYSRCSRWSELSILDSLYLAKYKESRILSLNYVYLITFLLFHASLNTQ